MGDIFCLKDQVAIVTGSSSGIGVEMAKALASKGARVALMARREERLVEVQKEIKEEYGIDSLPIRCDLTDESQIKSAVEKVVEEYGRIDILVNNAGYIADKPTVDVTLEEWNRVININLTGVFLMTKYVAPHMIEAEYGRIINIGSMNGLRAQPLEPIASYTASKGAIVNLTRQWAGEFSQYGITCNSIAPGMFPTEMMDGDPDADEDLNAYLQMSIPLGRIGRLDEIYGPVIFFASKSSSYVTGQTLPVDGGMTAI